MLSTIDITISQLPIAYKKHVG